MRKPNNYWNKENCRIEALKYSNKSEFQKIAAGAYSSIYRNGWENELLRHMVCKNRMWTKETCIQEGLKFKKRSDFIKQTNGAYRYAVRNGWVNDCISHMKKIQKYSRWSKELCKQEALKYLSKTEFKKNAGGAYNMAYYGNYLDEICSHMPIIGNIKKRCIYAAEFSDGYAYIGLTFNLNRRISKHLGDKRSQIYKHIELYDIKPIFKQITEYVDIITAKAFEGKYVNDYMINGWCILNIAKTGSVGGHTGYWTKELCKLEALKYKNKKDFTFEKMGAYLSAQRNGWLDEICQHMIPKKGFWSLEKCYEEALKYNTRGEFQKKSHKSYYSAQRNGWLDEICKHMLPSRNKISKDRCYEEAKKYTTRNEFNKKNGSVYKASRKYGILNEVCDHMLGKNKYLFL